jgi:hypothetical protein
MGLSKKGADGKLLVLSNPARDVSYLKSNNPAGYHTWTLDEVHQFEGRHPIGSPWRSCCSRDSDARISRG